MTMGKPTLRCWLCWLVGAIAIAFISYCAPTSAAPETESASGLLDDLGGGLFAPQKSLPPNADKAPKQVPSPSADSVQPANSTPLAQIVGNMKQAERLIVLQNLQGETAKVQDQVLADLDALIDQAQQQNQNNQNQQQQQQQQQQASQRNTPQAGQANQPAGQPQPGGANAARTSSDQLRQSREVDAAAGLRPQELLKDVWGQLPERVRQQLLQSSTDEFLPEYRDAIELYFRRLAEEESGTSP